VASDSTGEGDFFGSFLAFGISRGQRGTAGDSTPNV